MSHEDDLKEWCFIQIRQLLHQPEIPLAALALPNKTEYESQRKLLGEPAPRSALGIMPRMERFFRSLKRSGFQRWAIEISPRPSDQ